MSKFKTELGHVVFFVSDLDASIAFYKDIVGLEETGRTFNGRAAVLTGGSTHHELLLIQVDGEREPRRRGSIGLYHVGWCVGDNLDQLRAALKRVEAAGIEPIGLSDHGISHSLYLYDPDGNEVELYVDNPEYDWQTRTDWLDYPVKPLEL
ncbi:MAG: VOC family protein [Gammaproteobacteria bacterium]|nr:VOC family protein [Gammaproteobacteria bacterium]